MCIVAESNRRPSKSDTVLNVVIASGAVLAVAFFGYWIIAFSRINHDKAVNVDALQRLWSYGVHVPLNVVVPANNKWTHHAFVAERFESDPPRQTSVLILDDHYRGDDPTYRSEDGIIGNQLSKGLLCSLPAQASEKHVTLDSRVAGKIEAECKNGG
jgi:hypothetical protein